MNPFIQRNHRLGGAVLLSTIMAILPLTPVPAHPAQAGSGTSIYSVTDLGTLGGPFSRANAINNQGQIAGGSLTAIPDPTNPGSTEVHPFLWQNGVMTDLGTLGGPDASYDFSGNVVGATGINERGQISGFATHNAVFDPMCGPDSEHGRPAGGTCNDAFLWANGTMTDLGALGGVTGLGNSFSTANAINDRGQSAGGALTTIPFPFNPALKQFHAALWDGGVARDLGTLPGSRYSEAFGINDLGQVVGESRQHPFFWSQGVMTDVGTLEGPTGFALAINNLGQVVGGADTTIPDPSNPGGVLAHAFLWTGGQARDLGTIPSGSNSEAHGINNQGQIVGLECCAGDLFDALLWQNGTVVDLNTLIPASSGWYLAEADGINDRGQIVGWGLNPSGRFDAYLLTPSPAQDPGMGARDETVLAARSRTALAKLPTDIRRHLGLRIAGADGA